MKIIWYMVPGIQSTADRVFCHFLPFPFLLTQKTKILKKNKNSSKDIIILNLSTTTDDHMFGFRVYGTMNIVILDRFLPFYLRSNPENQHFYKMKNNTRTYEMKIICVYRSWEMEGDRIFCNCYGSFYPLYKINVFKLDKAKIL